MTKIRCGDSIALDLDQVVAWTKLEIPEHFNGGDKMLHLFFTGADGGFQISLSGVGEKAFNRLHKLLVARFAVDLVDDSSLPWANEISEGQELE